MTNKVVSSDQEFDEIELALDDLEEIKPTELKDSTDLNKIEEVDIELGDLEDLEPSNDTKEQPTVTKTPEVSVPPTIEDEIPDLDKPIETLDADPSLQTRDEEHETLTKATEPISVDIDNLEPESIPLPSLENKDYPAKITKKNSVSISDNLEPEIDKLSNEQFNPKFDISKLKNTKYQTRKTQRTEAEKVELAAKIQRQGQLEPIHVVKEGEEYQIVAGFGRYEAMMSLKMRSIKAIVHVGLTENEIVQLSFGTNEGRTELSEWDKICSIGSFLRDHPLFPIDDQDDPNSLVKIFGYAKDVIYRCLKHYKYFSMKPEFIEIFKAKKFPTFVYETLFESRGSITSSKRVVEYLKAEQQFNKKSFENTIYDIISELKLDSKISDDQQLAKDLNQQINKEDKTAAKILMEKLAEDEKKNKEDIQVKVQLVIDLVKQANEKTKLLLENENIKSLIDQKQFRELNKILKQLNQNHLKLY